VDVACPVGLVAEEQLVKANMARTQTNPKGEIFGKHAVSWSWSAVIGRRPFAL
jgi:hypothetical protein